MATAIDAGVKPPKPAKPISADAFERVLAAGAAILLACVVVAVLRGHAEWGAVPVIVWLHGGAFLSGAGSLDWYDGAALARTGDVVVVGVNYRLGPLGFLHLPGLGDGLMGLRDMGMALRFVAEHIAGRVEDGQAGREEADPRRLQPDRQGPLIAGRGFQRVEIDILGRREVRVDQEGRRAVVAGRGGHRGRGSGAAALSTRRRVGPAARPCAPTTPRR